MTVGTKPNVEKKRKEGNANFHIEALAPLCLMVYRFGS